MLCWACEDLPTIDPSSYACNLSFPDLSSSNDQKDDFQEAIDEYLQEEVAVQIAVKKGDQNWTASAGWADYPNEIPFEVCTPSMVGSISKVFTGVLLMQLHEEGILSVEDSLAKWLDPEMVAEIPNADKVTLRQCLNHTTGIPDYLEVESYLDAVNTPFTKKTQREKLEYIFGDEPNSEPGLSFDYSNSNYVILGLVVEKARNMSLWDAVKVYITDPMGLDQTFMGTEEDPIPDGVARPYREIASGKYQEMMHLAVYDAATGDGGIASNGQDLNEFITGIFDGRLMREESLQIMLGDSVSVSDQASFEQWSGEHYGLGIEIYQTPYGTAYGHTGSTSTYTAFLLYFPEEDISFATLYHMEPKGDYYEHRKTLQDRLLAVLFTE